MNDRWKLGTAATLGILLGGSVGGLYSQDRALVVAGMKVLLENERVRVQYHDVAVGETVALHSHPAYVAYVLKPYRPGFGWPMGRNESWSESPATCSGASPSRTP